MIKVRNMLTSNNNIAANQFIITTKGAQIFQSYLKTIVFLSNEVNTVFLDKNYWNYSRTTSFYRNKFLNTSSEETLKKITMNEYCLVDLNSNDGDYHSVG